MGVIFSGGNFVLDQSSEDHIKQLADDTLKKNHSDEYSDLLIKFRDIVYIQEIAGMKKYMETKHPEQVEQIYRLRAILNHQRIS